MEWPSSLDCGVEMEIRKNRVLIPSCNVSNKDDDDLPIYQIILKR